ncbi:MAG: hypothetical protein V4647_06465 [Pseudomonadota bacterium]
MIKKIIGSTVLAGAVTLSSVAATAAPIAFESADRTASPIGESEAAIDDAWLVVIFALLAAGIIVLITNGKGNDLPASP